MRFSHSFSYDVTGQPGREGKLFDLRAYSRVFRQRRLIRTPHTRGLGSAGRPAMPGYRVCYSGINSTLLGRPGYRVTGYWVPVRQEVSGIMVIRLHPSIDASTVNERRNYLQILEMPHATVMVLACGFLVSTEMHGSAAVARHIRYVLRYNFRTYFRRN